MKHSGNTDSGQSRWALKAGCAVVILCLGFLGWFWFSSWRSASLLRKADLELLVHHRYDVAEELARKLLWYQPDHSQGLLILGISLNRQQEYVESISYLEQVDADSEFRFEAEVTLASSLLNSGYLRRCEDVLVDHLETEPENIQAQDLLIVLYKQTLRIPEAIQVYESRLRGGPDDELTLRTILDLLVGSVSTSAVADRLLASPRYQVEADALAALGQIAVLKGNAENAKSNFSKALALDSACYRIILWSAAFHTSSGDLDRGDDLLGRCDEREISASHQTPRIRSEYWRLRALIADSNNDLIAALGHCETSLNELPQPETLSLKAGLLRKLNRLEEAKATARQVSHLGHLDFELLKLGTELRSKPVTAEEARQVSAILKGLGYPKQSAAWSRIAESLANQENNSELING